jgi:hypothetical protein
MSIVLAAGDETAHQSDGGDKSDENRWNNIAVAGIGGLRQGVRQIAINHADFAKIEAGLDPAIGVDNS